MRFALAVMVLAGCDDLVGFGGDVPPLATVELRTTGAPVGDAPALHAALVWGAQSLPEVLCFLPPESDAVAAVVLAGCRDPFGFTPARVAADVAIVPGETAELALFALPAADVMVGDLTARIAYASLVVYDDRDGDGTLGLGRRTRPPGNGGGPPDDEPPPDEPATSDVIHGASFVSMTEPDARLAFREGGFDAAAAFYPRVGCGDPLPSFSILRAGGFSIVDAVAATARGELPMQDPASCREDAIGATVVEIPLVEPATVREIGCEQRSVDSSVVYREPPVDSPLDGRTYACAAIPDFGTGAGAGITQLVVASDPADRCRGLAHYLLRGCDDSGFDCPVPEWDFTATPPAWWPCAGGATP